MYKYILFDLDGTLTDSAPGIIRCVQYALEKCGKGTCPDRELLPFIGPPLTESFQKVCGMTLPQKQIRPLNITANALPASVCTKTPSTTVFPNYCKTCVRQARPLPSPPASRSFMQKKSWNTLALPLTSQQ